MECSTSSPLAEQKREETEEAAQFLEAGSVSADMQPPADTLQLCNASLRRNFDHVRNLLSFSFPLSSSFIDTCMEPFTYEMLRNR